MVILSFLIGETKLTLRGGSHSFFGLSASPRPLPHRSAGEGSQPFFARSISREPVDDRRGKLRSALVNAYGIEAQGAQIICDAPSLEPLLEPRPAPRHAHRRPPVRQLVLRAVPRRAPQPGPRRGLRVVHLRVHPSAPPRQLDTSAYRIADSDQDRNTDTDADSNKDRNPNADSESDLTFVPRASG
jgi:hypothetical protein